jgi:hypothetical protein
MSYCIRFSRQKNSFINHAEAHAKKETLMSWTMTCTHSTRSASYAPPVVGNGQLSLQADYQGAQFQKSYQDIFPTIWWAGRRYDTSMRELIPFGHFEQSVRFGDQEPVEPESWEQFLQVHEASIRSEAVYGKECKIKSEIFIHADKNVIAITKQIDAPEGSQYTFRYVFSRPGPENEAPRRVNYQAKTGPDGSAELVYQADEQAFYEGQISLLADSPCDVQANENVLSLTVPVSRKRITFFIILADNQNTGDFRREAEQMKDEIRQVGVEGLKHTHKAAWKSFWDRSFISLPETDIESVYLTALYHLRCIATPWSIPVAIADKYWHGRYFGFDEHFAFMGLLTSNHLEEAKRVPDFRFQGLKAAYVRASQYNQVILKGGARYPWITVETGEESAQAGIWIDHVFHMAHIALSAWQYYRYSHEISYLEQKGYPILEGCADFFYYQSVYDVADGRTIIGKYTDLERLGPAVENAYMTTCSAIATLKAAAQAARILDTDPKKRDAWEQTADRLKKFLPHDGEKYIPFPGCTQKSVAVLSGLFPYGIVETDDTYQRQAIEDFCQSESQFGNMYPVGESVCPWYAAWKAVVFARLLDGHRAYAATRQGADTAGCFSELFEINEPSVSIKPWFSTAEGTWIQGVNEMLVQSDEKTINIAPAVPDHWKIFLFKLACIGGRTVHVRVVDRCLIDLSIDPSTAPTGLVVTIPNWMRIHRDLDVGSLQVQKRVSG